VKQKAGIAKPSFMSRLIEARDKHAPDEEEAVKNFTDADLQGAGGVLYSAGQDTTYATETIFTMAMLLYPDVQIQAQKEIDAVTGRKRLPNFDDWKALPIIERMVYETLRYVTNIRLPRNQLILNQVPYRRSKWLVSIFSPPNCLGLQDLSYRSSTQDTERRCVP
jgi:cytochrome P450